MTLELCEASLNEELLSIQDVLAASISVKLKWYTQPCGTQIVTPYGYISPSSVQRVFVESVMRLPIIAFHRILACVCGPLAKQR